MASRRDLQRRVQSVTNTQHITKAMKMVSASKLRKAQNMVLAVRPYAHKMEDVIHHIHESGIDHHYLEPRARIRRVAYLLVGADRGLCGGYNSHLHHHVERVLAHETRPFGLVVVGRRIYEYCLRQGWPVDLYYTQIGDNPSFGQCRLLSEKLRHLYYEGEYDEVQVIYNEFVSALSYLERERCLLPVQTQQREHLTMTDYILEPDPERLLRQIVPQYLDVMLYTIMQEAKASEHGARMTAMNGATDNAKEMLDDLTLSLHRARQAHITTEISEIVSGAAALE